MHAHTRARNTAEIVIQPSAGCMYATYTCIQHNKHACTHVRCATVTNRMHTADEKTHTRQLGDGLPKLVRRQKTKGHSPNNLRSHSPSHVLTHGYRCCLGTREKLLNQSFVSSAWHMLEYKSRHMYTNGYRHIWATGVADPLSHQTVRPLQ